MDRGHEIRKLARVQPAVETHPGADVHAKRSNAPHRVGYVIGIEAAGQEDRAR